MQYISLRQVHRLIASNYPFGAVRLAESLEEYLCHLKATGERLPDTLLAHNLSGRRDRAACEVAAIDADILHDLEITTGTSNTELKDYRVHTQFARRPEEHRVVIHVQLRYPDRTMWAIHFPLQAAMKGFGDPEAGYQCYAHSIALLDPEGRASEANEHVYCGITGRNWLDRMGEHFREVRTGSNKLFHRAWRDYQGRSDVLLNSELIVLNQSFERAMAWEEWLVERYKNEGRSLNMIAGGFKGLKELHRLGYLARQEATLEDRDRALQQYAKEHPRAGVPNLLIAGLWEDDSYYARVIEARSNTLSRDQVRRIRYLASLGWEPDRICAEVGARNIDQVRRVMRKKAYVRMH